jgi:hypothetical protein
VSSRILSAREANAIPITEYLACMGINPVKIRGNDSWYLSPFRNERTPSFKVNVKLNLWYDHGIGEGGTLIDLGIRIEKISYQMFIEKVGYGNYSNLLSSPQRVHKDSFSSNKLLIQTVSDLKDPNLVDYLRSRAISLKTAAKFCKEVKFRIAEREYLAVGFPNRSGGFELRNKWFKGSSSPKDILIIDNGSQTVSVFEGFIDFLSAMVIQHQEINNLTMGSDFVVLNSLAMVNCTLPILQNYKVINLFLDNDLAAKDVKLNLDRGRISYCDGSNFYRCFKDVNEFLMNVKNGKRYGKNLRI